MSSQQAETILVSVKITMLIKIKAHQLITVNTCNPPRRQTQTEMEWSSAQMLSATTPFPRLPVTTGKLKVAMVCLEGCSQLSPTFLYVFYLFAG